MNNKVDHVWHVWINEEGNRLREWQRDNPSGETETIQRRGKDVEVPISQKTPLTLIDPHERGLYSFKSAMGMIGWLTKMIGTERIGTMPLVHQQCSHQQPEPIPENILTCGLGVKLRECPILSRLRETFDRERNRQTPSGKSYYAEITDEQIDNVSAMTCLWHMLMGTDSFIDWQEGAVQSTSDRMFWQRVYENLAMSPEEGQQEESE